jgi:hypothetical protein
VTPHVNYKDQLADFQETSAVYCENQTDPTNSPCRQSADFLKVKVNSAYTAKNLSV